MKVSQLSVFLENKSGRLADVTRTLAEGNVNIRALSVADSIDYGLLRLIVDDPAKAVDALSSNGFRTKLTDVLAIEIPDKPGGLASVIDVFASGGVNIEYMYAFVGTSGENAIVIFRIENPDQAVEILQKQNVRILRSEELQKL